MKRSPLRRGKPLARKAPLRSRTAPQRGGWLRRLTRLRAVNPERKARLLAHQDGPQSALCRTLPCIVCGAPPPSHPHHVRSRGAGGGDDATVALCWHHHRQGHDIGWRTFEAMYQVDLGAAARETGALVEGSQ